MIRNVYILSANEWMQAQVNPDAPRMIFYNGKRIEDLRKLDPDEANYLEGIIDDFESGDNWYIDGFEVIERGKFQIKRKVTLIE